MNIRTFLLWPLASVPAAWLFGVAIQYQWIKQRCGTAELLIRNQRLCADNELRMLLGGPVTALILLIVFFALLSLFHKYLNTEREAVARRMALAYQVLGLSGLVFIPGMSREETIAGVACAFFILLVSLLSKHTRLLVERLFPKALPAEPVSEADEQYFRRLLYGALAMHFVFSLVGFLHPITDHHSFRQTQTALSTYWMIEDGFKLWYETPMFGKPWSVPMEFPLYQYLCAFLVKLTGIHLEQISRLVSLASFYGVLYFVSRLLKELKVHAVTRYLILTLLALAPLHIYYARSVLIETFTLFLAVVWIWTSFRFLVSKKWVWLLPGFVFGSACALSKVTTFSVFGFFQIGLFWWTLEKPVRKNFELRKLMFYLAAGLGLVILPLAVGALWVHESDKVKLLNPMIGDGWTSKALREWNFGTLNLRLSFAYWRSIFWSNLHDILGYLGIPILLIFVYSVLRSNLQTRLKYFFLLATFLFGPLVFANLYYIHDYYYVACAVFLLVAVGTKLGEFYLESGIDARRSIRSFLITSLLFSMLIGYFGEYFRKQLDAKSHPMEQLGIAIRKQTEKADVVVAHGYASPELPYYTQRKMLVGAGDVRQDASKFMKALNELRSERIGVVILPTQWTDMERQHVLDIYRKFANFDGKKVAALEGYEVYSRK